MSKNSAALSLGVAVTALALAVAGCSSSTTAAGGSSSSSSAAATVTTTSPASSAPAAAAHNQADVTFAQQMIPHHRQAVEMSDMLLGKQGIDPRVTELATQIKAAQGPEIATMQGWLTTWGTPAPSSSTAAMPDMPGMDHSTMAAMPGMMSDQDMAALQNAQGVAASKTFLQKMIAHHQGAIAMAQTEIGTGQNPDAIALAKSIATTQQQEITTMQGILASM